MLKLADKNICLGCHACVNACVHQALVMKPDEEGFLQPLVDNDKCVECKACEKACPIISPKVNANDTHPKAYAVWSNPDRTVSSSGGAFSSFARTILKEGGVVYGAAWDERLFLHHIAIEKEDELDKLRGSKYVQSSIDDTYKDVRTKLCEARRVLFCGTPCQIAGLKNFLRKEYDNLLTLDLVCHGVPSDKVWQAYLEKIATRFAGIRPTAYEFRRRDGWGKAPSISLGGNWLKIYGVDALYMEAFDKCAIFRKSCYQCPYAKLPRIGDVTIADFWGLGRYGTPFKHNVMKGVSLVLINNQKGKEALLKLEDTFCEERTLKEALIENWNIDHVTKKNKNREKIIEAFLNPNCSLESIDCQFDIVDHSFKARIKEFAAKIGLFDVVKRVYNKYKTL